MAINIPNNWRPRLDQMLLWTYLESGGKRAVEVAHRRWGKDDVALHFTATQVVQRVGNYWHMLPQYSQARKSIWEAVNPRTGKRRIEEAFPQEIRRRTDNQEMFIKFKNGSTWQLVGSDSYNSLIGSPPIGLVNSEYAVADPLAWGYLRPILAENQGWSLFIYTPRGKNHGRNIYDLARTEPGWFAQMLTARQTPVFGEEQLEQERRELIGEFGETEGQMFFEQEYLCSFEGFVRGAYYSKQILKAREEGRIGNVPWVPRHEVYTFWDLGFDDSTSIWFLQTVGKEFRWIDYYENTGEGLDHYSKILKEKPYSYGEHYLPHDGATGHITTGDSPKDTLEKLGIKPIRIVPRARDTRSVLMGIDNARNWLPQCWFDEKKCLRGLQCLEGYQAEYDEEKKKLGNHPLHNWCSHGADAFRTYAVGYVPRLAHRSVSALLEATSILGGW